MSEFIIIFYIFGVVAVARDRQVVQDHRLNEIGKRVSSQH